MFCKVLYITLGSVKKEVAKKLIFPADMLCFAVYAESLKS